MVEYTLKIEGADKIKKVLERAPFILRKHLRRAMQKVGFSVQRPAQVYPPPPSGSTYRRTGTLGRRWKTSVEQTIDGIAAIVENPTEYSPYVQGEEQAEVHRGRWRPIRKIIESLRGQHVKILEDAIAAAVKEMER
jgi:hypothetical protein